MASSAEADSYVTSSEDEVNAGPSRDNQRSQGTHPSLQPKKKRRKYIQAFQNEWLQDKKFKSWLKSPSKESAKPMCIFCSSTVPCTKSGLERHSKSEMHQKNARSVNSQLPANIVVQSSIKNSNYSLVTESRICAFIVEHNLPFSVSQPLLQLIKAT